MSGLMLCERPEEGIQGNNIGSILVSAGKLSLADLHRIIALQGKEDLLFGEAAVSLGILTEEDVRWALSCQYSYPSVNIDDNPSLSRELIVVHDPLDERVETFRSIRSGLIFSGVGKIIRTIAVLSPGEQEGRTFVAANLAVVFAQLGMRTLLIDLNFRSPRIHSLFHMKNNTGASSLIIKRALPDQAVRSASIDFLAVLPSGPKPPNPLELLSWQETAEVMRSLKDEFDVVVIDTPAFNKTADAMMIGSLSDGVLLTATKGKTKIQEFGRMKTHLDAAGTRILGTVMNEIRDRK